MTLNPEPTQAIAVREQLPPPSPAAESPTPAMTPAQARVDAVAHVLADAMAKASTLSLTPEEIAALKADFPHEAFKLGAGGDPNLIYIEHAFLRDRFDSAIGMGQWALVRSRPHWGEEFTTQKGEKAIRLYADCALLIRGCYCAEAIGEMVYYPNNARQSYADAAEGSETAAFRRCAKKLGVGLQAWKKDFCESWKHSQNAPGRAGTPRPPSAPVQTVKVPPAATSEQEKAKPTPLPTPESRSKMISELKAGPGEANRQIVTEFFQKCDCLLPTEDIEDLPLETVPATHGEMRSLGQAIAEFGNGEMAHLPYARHEMMMLKPPKPIEVPRDTKPTESDVDEWFMKVVVPIPRKGQKRDDYLHSPDTIGSLYEARHGDDEDAQMARQRLWGFVNHFEVKGWTKKDGTQMPPTDTDKKFREALDAFGEWFQKVHPDEKL